MKRVFGSAKPILLTSFGWPGNGGTGQDILTTKNIYTGEQCGVANNYNQVAVNQRYINWLGANNIGGCLYNAFSEPWLAFGDTKSFLNYWGICQATDYNCDQTPGAVGRQELAFPPLPPSKGWVAGVAVGATLGGLTVCLMCCCCIVLFCVALYLYKRKKPKKEQHVYKVIAKELERSEPNYEWIESSIIKCGTGLAHPTKLLLCLMNITPTTKNIAVYLRIADMLAMLALVNKKKLKKKHIVKLLEAQEHLRQITLFNSTLQYNFDCAHGYLELLIAGNAGANVDQVIQAVSTKAMTLDRHWLYQVMLIRLIAWSGDTTYLHRTIQVPSETDWHILYTLAQSLGYIVVIQTDNTSIQIGEEPGAVTAVNLLGRPYTDIAACTLFTKEQNRAIRIAMILSLQDIVTSTCSQALKDQAVMMLIGRELQETDSEVCEVVYQIMRNVNVGPYIPYVIDNWDLVINWYNQIQDKPTILEQRLETINRNIQACEIAIIETHNLLSSTQLLPNDEDKLSLQQRIHTCTTTLETLSVERDCMQQARLQAVVEFNIVKNNLEKMQEKYK
jgi:hypothetical protein